MISRYRSPKASSPAAHPLDWLQRGHAETNILAQAQQRLALEESLYTVLPATLHAGCRVGQWEQGQLTLIISSTQHASRIRHLLPSLLKDLQRRWPIKEIQIRVLPQAGTSATHPQAQRPPAAPTTKLSPNTIAAFSALKNELPAGPLAEALQQLVQNHQHK